MQLGARLTGDVASVRAALDAAQSSGQTALVDGTYAGIMVGESDAGRALLIVFSDGVDTSSWLRADAVLDTARRADVVVYGVSVVVAAQAGVSARDHVAHGRTAVRDREDDEPGVDVSRHPRRVPPSVSRELHAAGACAKDGWHKLDVRVKNRRATIKARPGYLAGDASRN